jgi:hypothetical protein
LPFKNAWTIDCVCGAAGKSTLLRNLAARRIEGLPQSLRVALVQHAADSSVPAGSASAAGAASHAGGGGHGHGSSSDETVAEHLVASASDGTTVDAAAAEAFARKVAHRTTARGQ